MTNAASPCAASASRTLWARPATTSRLIALPDDSRSILATIADPTRSVVTTSEVIALHEMQQQPAERRRVNEADPRPARTGPAHVIDHPVTGPGEAGEGGVDVRRLQREMVQAGAAPLDVAGDRALVAARVAGRSAPSVR